MTPSPSLVANLRVELMRKPPFSRMQPAHVEALVTGAVQIYHAPGEVILSPEAGVVDSLFCIRSGAVTHRPRSGQGGDFQFEAGDLFPLGAMMGARAVTGIYTALQDTFCLRIAADLVHELASLSGPFADFLNRSILTLLEASQRQLREGQAAQALADQSLETPLGELLRQELVSVEPGVTLSMALNLMHARRVGSIPVAGAAGEVLGILTRSDVLGRVTLPQLPLETPIETVMTSPVRALTVDDSALDAALLMSQHGIRHVAVTDAARLVGIVSERDLFAIQRLSLKQVGVAIRSAQNVEALQAAALDIRRFAGTLLGQGVQARQLTGIISRLNDTLTIRLVDLIAQRHALDMAQACWLAAGSEGRQEQTIATDQDNGLIFQSDQPGEDRPRWLAFAHDVNHALDACGYPLCRGGVMASNPQWCLTAAEWGERFGTWISRGEPEDLLNASIWLDLRPLAGQHALAALLRPLVHAQLVRYPRFLRTYAAGCLRHRVPIDWLGGIDATARQGRRLLDIKLNGTMIYVDAARVYALANGIDAVNTRVRFELIAKALRVPAREGEGWVGGFEFLQMLRLRGQIEHARGDGADDGGGGGEGDGDAGGGTSDAIEGKGGGRELNPNVIDIATLNEIDYRILKESLRIARRLQQRLELDFGQ